MFTCLGAIEDTYVVCRLSAMAVHVHFQDLWKLKSWEIPSSDMIVIVFDPCTAIKTGGHNNLELSYHNVGGSSAQVGLVINLRDLLDVLCDH